LQRRKSKRFLADTNVFTAACIKIGATLISNDRHFEAIGRAKPIRVLKTSEAIGEILG